MIVNLKYDLIGGRATNAMLQPPYMLIKLLTDLNVIEDFTATLDERDITEDWRSFTLHVKIKDD